LDDDDDDGGDDDDDNDRDDNKYNNMHNNTLIHSGPGVNECESPELRSTIYTPPQIILMDNE
jgi:hypothetical protein